MCRSQFFPAIEPTKATVYYSPSNVVGIVFEFTDTTTLRLGQDTGDNVQSAETLFSLQDQFIGLYGLNAESAMQQVGFLTHDPQCSLMSSDPTVLDTPAKIEEHNNNVKLIVIVVATSAALITVCVVVCC